MKREQGKRKLKPWQYLALFLCLCSGFLLAASLFGSKEEAAEQPVVTEEEAVSAEPVVYETEFFSDYRQKRAGWRSEENEYFEQQLAIANAGDDWRQSLADAQKEAMERNQKEDQVEELLRGRHYEDALLIIGEDLSFLVVKKESLSEDERDELANFVYAYTSIPSQTLSVYNVF